jgi:hypothetical protein
MTWYNISASFSIQADEEKADAIADYLTEFIGHQLEAELSYVSVMEDKERPDVPEPEPEKPDAKVIPFRPRNETL